MKTWVIKLKSGEVFCTVFAKTSDDALTNALNETYDRVKWKCHSFTEFDEELRVLKGATATESDRNV